MFILSVFAKEVHLEVHQLSQQLFLATLDLPSSELMATKSHRPFGHV